MSNSLRVQCMAIAGAIGIVLLQLAPGAGSALQYERGLLASQPWRMLTAHWVHVNWTHALINAAALVVVARLFADELGARRQAIVILTCSGAISLALAALWPSVAWYRGLSGVLHALFFAGSAAWLAGAIAARAPHRTVLPLLLVAGGWIKVLIEQTPADALPSAEWLGAAVVPQAHLIGAGTGTALGLVFAIADMREQASRAVS